jgi:transposase
MREAAARHPEAKRVELWFEDGWTRRVQPDRAEGPHDPRLVPAGPAPARAARAAFRPLQLFGAVCPERGAGVALALPEVSTGAMTLFLAELARVVPAGTHAVLVLDRAGWHVSGDLVVPANLTLVHLPPYSPELNPVERVWLYLRERWLSHRVLAGYDAVLDAACAAWNALRAEPGRLRSLTAFPWLPAAVTNS